MHWLCRNIADYTDQQLRTAQQALSSSRSAHILKMQRPEVRVRSLAGELAVYELLRQLDITDARLHRAESGRPYLSGTDLFVSIAHSGDKVACAVSENPVGIDIERIRPIKRQLVDYVCVEEEARYVLGQSRETLLQDGDTLQRFFEVWTAKEAYFKKLGTGITDLKSVNILPMPRQMQRMDGYILQIL